MKYNNLKFIKAVKEWLNYEFQMSGKIWEWIVVAIVAVIITVIINVAINL